MKILVTGGTGLVGKAIEEISHEYNHEFIFLSSIKYSTLVTTALLGKESEIFMSFRKE
jgi:NAD dependent epimerase/dehydratase family enzyme